MISGMIIRRISMLAVTLLPAAAALTTAATATADPWLQPPVIEQVIVSPGNASVKFHNPNDEGVCWIYRDDTGEILGGNNPVAFAVPGGRMVQTSTGANYIPAQRIPLRGACSTDRPATGYDGSARTDIVYVDVPERPRTGSF